MGVANRSSGLDNAGKTTIVKKMMNEDVSTVSPTLGFIIRTIDYRGLVSSSRSNPVVHIRDRYKLNICTFAAFFLRMMSQRDCGSRGRRGPENASIILAELL